METTTTSHKVTKLYSGCYRVSIPGKSEFGQVKKSGREWTAEIRRTESGCFVRPAGIWSTRRDAIEECVEIIRWSAPA